MSLKQEVLSAANQFSLSTYSQQIILSEGQGSYVTDIDGNQYLDFAAGIAVCNLGHCHPTVTNAIQAQAAKLCHISNLWYNEKQPLLAKKIAECSFGGRVFFCNSGAEANEGMIKLARRKGSSKNRNLIICIDNAFHGRTLATLAATGKQKYLEGFSPDLDGFIHVPMNDLDALKAAYTDQCCAVMLEAVQGEGGIIPATQEFMTGIRQFCDEKEMLMMIDEVQTGFGRTGTFFAYQHYNITPDVMSMAKALGNGFPIGAFEARQDLNDILVPGTHATTFGGNPLGCAAGLAVMEAFEKENILENCQKLGAFLKEELTKLAKKYNCITAVRGRGLIIGAELTDTIPVGTILDECRKNNLLVLPAGNNVLRLLPPLNITKQQARQAIEIIDQALATILQK
jgi:predicted acetylornithine/succinylornithine family transaminase